MLPHCILLCLRIKNDGASAIAPLFILTFDAKFRNRHGVNVADYVLEMKHQKVYPYTRIDDPRSHTTTLRKVYMSPEITKISGHDLDLNDFSGLAMPEEIKRILFGNVGKYMNVPNVDVHVLAGALVRALYEAKESFDPSKGTAFTTHLRNCIRYTISAGFASKDFVAEGSIRVQRYARKKTPVSYHRLNAEKWHDNGPARSVNDQIIPDDTSPCPATSLEVREELEPLRIKLAETLAILRVIPLQNDTRARDMEVFETVYGLNDHDPTSYEKLAERWSVHLSLIPIITEKVWKLLATAKAPIDSPLELQHVLFRIESLENILGETTVVRAAQLTPEQHAVIRSRFIHESIDRKRLRTERKRSRDFQLNLRIMDIPGPLMKKQRLIALVSQSFGFSVEELRSEKLMTDRAAKARYILAYLLAEDHGASNEEIGKLIGRSPDMAKHGRYYIERLLFKKDQAVIQAIAQIRIRYQAH